MKEVIVEYIVRNDDKGGSVTGVLVAELIRCKDCKYYEEFIDGRGFFCSNERIDVLCGEPKKEDFCGWAERREE